ncbi:MAG TPA: M48 family metallopeptidase [Rubrivivax sp.]|mgnify:CR=1 FL=1|nr:M48 family metallopeptidase [Rubrivivax sp.]
MGRNAAGAKDGPSRRQARQARSGFGHAPGSRRETVDRHCRQACALRQPREGRPVECIEYIVVHELLHLAEPNRGGRFVALMNRHLPRWAAARKRLNAAPLGHEEWEV